MDYNDLPSDHKYFLSHEMLMGRCIQLAVLGSGFTAPNPMVGAILVYEGRIIGEGYHKMHGGPHAEVNCIHSVKPEDRFKIPLSTLYVSLEPCCHHGKTPPCTDLIIEQKIPKVIIGCRDPFPAVNGKGIDKLIASGIETLYPVGEWNSREINKRFFTFHQKKRPYIILKWAESANMKISGPDGNRLNVSNKYSNRLVHRWRSEEAAILIGTNTAEKDNPQLTNRLWPGKSPLRVILDQNLRLPDTLHVFDASVPTIVLNGIRDFRADGIKYKKIQFENPVIPAILSTLHDEHILSVLVEGGSTLLQHFIDSKIWDEIRIIRNRELNIPKGISSPDFQYVQFQREEIYGSDSIRYYKNEYDLNAPEFI